MGLLSRGNVELWRKGRIDFLEQAVQGNPNKIVASMALFRAWASEKGLKPSETRYVRRTRDGTVDLRFSESGDPAIENHYRTHFLSPALSEQEQKRLQAKLDKDPKVIVFQTLRDGVCSECRAELEQDSFLFMEAGQPLCLACAGIGDLEFLPAGDVALTRRAAKYSKRTAVVVRFSRARKRYERQGILVEASALEKAEQECSEDADEHAADRARAAERRRVEDRELVARVTEQIGRLFPGCPPGEAARIAEHTARRGTGRIGRTETGRNLEEQALTLAVVAAIRHIHTDYDELLANGFDRANARRRVSDKVDDILERWRK
jgi:hypothetical protein